MKTFSEFLVEKTIEVDPKYGLEYLYDPSPDQIKNYAKKMQRKNNSVTVLRGLFVDGHHYWWDAMQLIHFIFMKRILKTANPKNVKMSIKLQAEKPFFIVHDEKPFDPFPKKMAMKMGAAYLELA